MTDAWWLLLIAIAASLLGGALVGWLAAHLRGRRPPEEQRLAPALDSRLVAEAVTALQVLGAEARAVREVLQRLSDAVQTQLARGVPPLGAAAPAPAVFATERPLTLVVRGISNFNQLVQIERTLTGHEAIRSAGIESYQEGQVRFLLLLRRPLPAETLQTALMVGLGMPISIEAAEPDRGELRLTLNTDIDLSVSSSPQPRR